MAWFGGGRERGGADRGDAALRRALHAVLDHDLAGAEQVLADAVRHDSNEIDGYLALAHPAKALEIIAAGQFDLIIVSTLLSDTDGLRLCAQIRSQEKTRQIPILAIAALVIVLALAFRLSRRIDRGPTSAGPVETEPVTPPGQEPSPWELRAIDEQLQRLVRRDAGVRRSDLTGTVNRLITAAGLPATEQLLPGADLNQLAATITRTMATDAPIRAAIPMPMRTPTTTPPRASTAPSTAKAPATGCDISRWSTSPKAA